MVEQTAKKALDGYEEKTEDLKETKSWISEDERQHGADIPYLREFRVAWVNQEPWPVPSYAELFYVLVPSSMLRL